MIYRISIFFRRRDPCYFQFSFRRKFVFVSHFVGGAGEVRQVLAVGLWPSEP